MPTFTTRPVIMARRGAVTSGHYLATAAGHRMLEAGGNAIDAAAAMCFCLNLLEPHNNGLGGEVPVLVYSAVHGRVYAISGLGFSPAALSIPWCRDHGVDIIPGDGYLPACVPAVVGTWALALKRFGTMGFGQVLAPAIELAENGFPVYPGLHEHLAATRDRYREVYPSTYRLYYPGGNVPEVGQLLVNRDLAGTLNRMADAEQAAAGKGRAASIDAASDVFYKGPIAERIVAYAGSNPVTDALGSLRTALLSAGDLARWQAAVEAPVSVNWRDLQVHKCSTWTQGPVFCQQLRLLAGFDLTAMGHNSEPYLHTLIECAKLAFADREAYYGDPLFDDVPLDRLLSVAYADQRRKLIGPIASDQMRPGDVGRGIPVYAQSFDVLADHQQAIGRLSDQAGRDMTWANPHAGDTTQLDAADAAGNMVAATPSGGWIRSSPLIDGLGFCLGTRGQMFYLNPNRPSALAPHKRPRATLTPTLVTRNGQAYMAFGTPGGDSQDQTTLQFFLNCTVFGMNLQEAADAPTVVSNHFPSSFYPRVAFPAQVSAEDRLPRDILDALAKRRHEVKLAAPWSHGRVMGIYRDPASGVLHAAASPREQIAYAMGW